MLVQLTGISMQSAEATYKYSEVPWDHYTVQPQRMATIGLQQSRAHCQTLIARWLFSQAQVKTFADARYNETNSGQSSKWSIFESAWVLVHNGAGENRLSWQATEISDFQIIKLQLLYGQLMWKLQWMKVLTNDICRGWILRKILVVQVDIIGLPDGSVLLAYNNNDTARTPLTLARSFDGGLSWRNVIVIENDPIGSFAYPTLLYETTTVCHCWQNAFQGDMSGIHIVSVLFWLVYVWLQVHVNSNFLLYTEAKFSALQCLLSYAAFQRKDTLWFLQLQKLSWQWWL